MYECLKPIISACNGPSVGVGVTMQLAMDIRLASEQAKYGFVFARRGLVPEACSSWFLPRIVGISKALEWIYSGKVFGPNEALEGGLIRSIHGPDELIPAAREIAREIIENTAPVSIALSRQMILRMAGAKHPMDAHKIDSRGIFARGRMSDAKEGVESFLEKRPAEFKDSVNKDLPEYYPWWDEEEYS
jgi:enoyl-CoA hydratase/carnithine racemase